MTLQDMLEKEKNCEQEGKKEEMFPHRELNPGRLGESQKS